MIIPTLPISHFRLAGFDVHGKTRLALVGRLKVCPVKLIFEAAHTTVRTDSSGSIGHADEEVANVVLLALPAAGIKDGDVLLVSDRQVEVFRVHDRYTVTGKHDHRELHCRAWK